MATRPLVTRSLMDEFLPHCDFGASYEVRINAPASVVYESLLRSDFSDIWLVRLLMSIRSGKRLPRNRMPGDLRQRLQGTGFVVLAEAPNEEIVIGVAGRFWRPDGGRCIWNSLRRILPGFLAPATRRWRGTSSCGKSRLRVQFSRPRQGSSVSDKPRCGNSEAIGVWLAPSRGLCARRFL